MLSADSMHSRARERDRQERAAGKRLERLIWSKNGIARSFSSSAAVIAVLTSYSLAKPTLL